MMYEEGEYSSLDTLSSEKEKKKKKKKKKENDHKRRFTDDQIKSLETIFESDTKLEPRKKLQVARELGLQPRQVAIWFQNKRARWKSKQLGRDYNILRSNYNNLASKFDTLKKEKQSLVVQLLGLRDRMEKSGKEVPTTDRKSGNNGESDLLSEHGVGILSDDFGLNDESDLLNMVEVELGDGSLTSTEDWDNLESNDDLLDQSSSSYYPWWDFWS